MYSFCNKILLVSFINHILTKKTNPHSKLIHIASIIVWANAFLTTLATEAQKKTTTISTSTLSLHGLHASNNSIHPKKMAVLEKTQALSLNQNSYRFLDTRLKLDLDNESNYHEINLGLAKRHPLHDKELVGLYGFHDLTHTESVANKIIEVDKDDQAYCDIWKQPLLTNPSYNYNTVKNKIGKVILVKVKNKLFSETFNHLPGAICR